MTERTPRVEAVVVSDSFHGSLTDLVKEAGGRLSTRAAEGGAPADTPAAVLVMAGGREGEALAQLPTLGDAPWYFIGSTPDHRIAAAAVRAGASDYLVLPEDLDVLRRSLERDIRTARARVDAAEFAAKEGAHAGFAAIIGRSPELTAVLEQAKRVAGHRDVTVLLGGETGTGKELLARAIHYASPRAAQPFVEVNCAAIPANLLESELFGHERGAFTGAVAAKPGLFEQAHGGTLFLDEIGHMPLELQAKILRALESREIRRVGGTSTKKVDIRLLAATHLDLAKAVREKAFREDLYYRLNVVRLVLPPLRDRGNDLELLAETFAAELAERYGLPVPASTTEFHQALRTHNWPGNVRELRNALERVLVLSKPGTLEVTVLDFGTAPDSTEPATGGTLPFPADLATITMAAVQAMLALCDGNKSAAARRLGISRPRLQRVLDQVDD
ncbi:MAG TPA: sigma 54-interacting transcriptional regulator [Gemmatimonadales bacterium]|mgnify:CR=1 FL=1|nr:sigma 54-interacting transcriptional regulator [Gemmatimonadales bacterium]